VAEPQINVNVVLDVDPESADFIGQTERQAERAARQISGVFNRLARNANRSIAPAFEEIRRQIRSTVGGVEGLKRAFDGVDRSSDALRASFGDAFDPRNVDGFQQALQRLIALTAKFQEGGLDEIEFNEARQELRGLGTAVVALSNNLQAAERAADELRRNAARDARQLSREQIEASRDARARFVVEEQRKASAARDSARQRVATIQATARTIATIERGLSTIFRQTARVLSTAFRSAAQAVTGIAAGIGRAFQSATTNIRNSVTNNSRDIRNSYDKTFNETTNIVRNETSEQQSIISNFARQASQSIGGIGAGAGAKFALGGIAAAAGVTALRTGFERATTIETANRGLEVLLGNAEEAERLLDAVVETVTGTPFALDQFARGASRLVAFGVEAERIPGILSAIGDAAALSGADAAQTIDTLIRVTGQAQATGKLYGDQLIQLGEAGVPALRILGNAFNKQAGEIQELLTDGTIPAQEALDALFKGIQEGTDGINGATAAFGGLAKELGDTLAGAVSNFRISFARAGANLFETFTPALVAASKAATAAVDLIGSAFNSLAQAIVDSPAFGLIQRLLTNLGSQITDVRKALKPVFDFIADGLVIVGQVVLGFQAFRRIPGVLGLVTVAVRRLLTPFNLFFGAVTLIAAGLQRVIEASPDLRTALETIASQFGTLLSIVGDLASQGLRVLGDAIATIVIPAAEGLAIVFADFVLPAVTAVVDFIAATVIPAFRRFAEFVEQRIFPVVGEALGRAIEIGQRAFDTIVNFIRASVIPFLSRAFDTLRTVLSTVVTFVRERVIPVIGESLARAVEIGRGAFEVTFQFLRDDFVPFLQDNLVPALAAVGAALGVFALTGSPLITALAGLTGAAVVALSNEDIRNAIVDTVRDGIDRAKELWNDFIDSGVLATIGIQVLKITRTIGEKIGAFVSDPNFVAALGAVVAAAVALGGAFVLGLIEGIESNIGDLIRGLQDLLSRAFQEAVKAAISDPRVGLTIVGLIGSATLIRRFRAQARQTGAIVASEFGNGFTANANLTGGNTTRGFFRGLTGGPAAIQRAGLDAGRTFSRSFATSVRRNNDLVRFLRGTTGTNPLALQQERNARGQFTGNLAPTTANQRALNDELQRFRLEAGNATVAGGQFRLGLRQIRTSIGRTSRSFTTFRDGLANLGQGLKGAGRQLGASLGVVAGAAFAVSFISQALLDTEASGQERLAAGLGTIATGAAAGFQLGGAKGAAIGAGVAGVVGLISSSFERGQRRAEEFAASVTGLADALEDLEPGDVDFTETLETNIRDRLRDTSDAARDTLIELGFSYESFAAAIENNRGLEFIAGFFEDLGPQGELFAQALRDGEVTLGRIDDTISGSGGAQFFEGYDIAGFQQEIKDAGLSVGDVEKAFSFLGETLKVVDGTFEEIERRNLEENADELARSWSLVDESITQALADKAREAEIVAGATQVAADATQAYRDKITELDQARIDGLKEKVGEAKSALDEAGRAADTAREKLQAFLSGETVQTTLQGTVDEATIAIGGIGDALVGITDDANIFTDAVAGADFRTKIAEATELASNVLAEAQPATPEEAAALLQPLITAAEQSGAGDALIDGINTALERYNSEEGQNLLDNVIDADALVEQAQGALDEAELNLEIGITLPPGLFQGAFNDEAAEAFRAAGQASSDGYVEGIDDEEMKTAAREAAEAALAEAEAALGISSPSEAFKQLGRFSVDGYVLGFSEQLAASTENLRALGAALVDEVALGISESGEFLNFLDAGTDSAQAFSDGLRDDRVQASVSDSGRQLVEEALLGMSESGEWLDFLDGGADAAYAFSDGLRNTAAVASVADSGRQLVEAALSGMSESGQWLDFLDAGFNAGSAFARGLRNSTRLAAAAAAAVARAAEASLQNELEIESPSKVFEDLGRQTMEGFAAGIESGAQLAADAADAAVSAALDTTVASVGAVQADVTATAATAGGAGGATGSSNIEALGRAIAAASKPDVKIDQTFNESVDSRAVAADVAWRLT
jgi:tape measure domain-containing protein